MLSPRREQFCQEYLKDLNGAQAYLRTYPRCKNADVAARNAYRLLSFADVAARVAELRAEAAKRHNLDHDWVINRLKEEVAMKPDAHPNSARIAALKLIGQHIGMWGDERVRRVEERLDVLERGEDDEDRRGDGQVRSD